jgi:hypothetical protein
LPAPTGPFVGRFAPPSSASEDRAGSSRDAHSTYQAVNEGGSRPFATQRRGALTAYRGGIDKSSMFALVDALGNTLPDYAILAIMALAFALFGRAAAWLSNRLWFRRWSQRGSFDDKLADTAHTSLLGLSAFLLALMITNGLTSLSKTEDNVRQEGMSIYRLGRELDALGAPAAPAKAALAAYVQDVSGDEWRRLATAPNTLSPLAQRDLDALWTNVRGLQKTVDPTEPRRVDLALYVRRIESLRQSRLADSTSNIPNIFWLILVAFLAAASFLAGREASKRFGMRVNMIHMSAIGLAVGLVIVLDNPFRGQTSIEPTIIGSALGS